MKAPEIHQQSPHSPEAEMGVIASMMLGGESVIEDVQESVDATAFYIPAHQTLFHAITKSKTQKIPIDLITFTQQLRNDGLLQGLGGAAYVTELFTYVPTAANVDYYVEIVREKWIRREMIASATNAARQAYDESTDTEKILEELQARTIEIGQTGRIQESLKRIGDGVQEVLDSIDAVWRRRGHPIGISTGFADLDRMTGGFQKGRTYYVAARPAMGKSSLGTEFAEHVAIDNAESQHPVSIFSVEMTAHELTEVILCRRSEIDLIRLRDGFFEKEERERLHLEGTEVVKPAPIYIDDKSTLSIFEFRARARRAVRKLGVRLIIIDYIQRMCSTSRRAQSSREQELNEIAQGISQTAKELQVPIVVLAQLNREVEKRHSNRPQLADLRESGSMEQEAHFVGLLYRPSYYAKGDDHMRDLAEKYEMSVPEFLRYTELIIAKQRRGPVGTVKLRFTKEYAKFESQDEERPLYSNRLDERQAKDQDAEAQALAGIKEIFNATEAKE
jgi:replicative DNA helicase